VKLLAVVLATVVIVLIPLAHGSPIDPSTPGFWDAGDYDDVIIFLTSHLHFLDADTLPVIWTLEALVDRLVEHFVPAAHGGSFEPGSPRAPPAV
jgi:hypothetical protein